jgi:hypothetical protein
MIFSSNRHPALRSLLSMIFPENCYPLFGIILNLCSRCGFFGISERSPTWVKGLTVLAPEVMTRLLAAFFRAANVTATQGMCR